jgi:serine protease Do
VDNTTKDSTVPAEKSGKGFISRVPKLRLPRPSQPSVAQKSKTLHALFLVLIVGVIGFGGGWLGGKQAADDGASSASTQRIVLDKQGNLISQIAKEVGQSVVSVNVTSQSSGGGFGFFGFNGGQQEQSAGTGIILSEDGLIITNRHVVPSGTTNVNVTLSDGTELKDVEVVGRTSETDSLDIAFLKIKDKKGHDLQAAKIGKSSDMQVGESVVAIGNALGQFHNTVTTGIISGYGRSVQAGDASGGGATENLDDLFQTDAAINPGNSGGPLVNSSGEVIGINTAVADQAENIGFAIPIDNIKGLIKSVSEKGTLERPYIGVIYVPVTDSIAKEFDLSVTRGAYIPSSGDYGQDTIVDDGPADKAGIKEGDIITKVDGTAVSETASLASLLGKHTPGDTVTLTINRDGKTQDIDVTLGVMPDSTNRQG